MAGLISVFLCGVQKAATTTLHSYLSEHPALSPPRHKELHLFDNEGRDWTAPDFGDVDAHFAADDGARLRFESTPIYSFWPPSISRIRAYNPDARLILSFRDPFERAVSHWSMEQARGAESLPFADAIRVGRERLAQASPLGRAHRVYSYLERGAYAEQVLRVLSHFPRDQVLFLNLDDLADDPVWVLGRIAGFLGLKSFPSVWPRREHARRPGAVATAPTEADRRLVADYLRDELPVFARLTRLDISTWPTWRLMIEDGGPRRSKHRFG